MANTFSIKCRRGSHLTGLSWSSLSRIIVSSDNYQLFFRSRWHFTIGRRPLILKRRKVHLEPKCRGRCWSSPHTRKGRFFSRLGIQKKGLVATSLGQTLDGFRDRIAGRRPARRYEGTLAERLGLRHMQWTCKTKQHTIKQRKKNIANNPLLWGRQNQFKILNPGGRVPKWKLAQLIRRKYRNFHSHFWGVQSNYEATDNVFNYFKYPFIKYNRNNLKIQK